MKTSSRILFPFCLTIFLSSKIVAQNWEPVYVSETANFDLDGQVSETFLYLYPFSTNGDTIIGRFLPNLNEEAPCNSGIENGCVTSNICKVATSSFLQEYAVFMPGGVVEFQNPDTFQIHSLAHLGESWIFKTDEIGNPVIAEVTDQYSGTVLGQIDSIKVVSVADGTTFHLSKQHGITFWSDADVNFELSSIPARNLGGSNLSNASVFGFSPGDVFVYLQKVEEGYDEGSGYYASGSKGIIRHEIIEITESETTLFISMETARYFEDYILSDWFPQYSNHSEIVTNNFEIPLTDDCYIYRWPIGGLMPAGIPLPIQTISQNFGIPVLSCNQNLIDCTETSLLYGHFYFNKLASGNFGNRSILSSSMDLYDGPGLEPNSSPLDVITFDPREFYEWEELIPCGFSGTDSSHLELGNNFLSDTENTANWYETHTYALGEGLGIVAFDSEYLGLGSWCMDRTVMIGYQKTGEEPFGFIPESLDLLTLSTGENNTASSLNVFPNPASTTVRIDMPGVVLSNATIHDMQGRQLFDVRLLQNEPIIDVSNLPKGMYLLRVVTQNGEEFVKKLVVE
jgi:hypothetical protein